MARFLVLDADSAVAALAAVSVDKNGSPEVQALLTLPVDRELAPLSAGALLFGQSLKVALKSAGIAAAPLVVLLKRDRIIVKDVKYPPTPPADEPAVVRFQASRDLAEGAGDVVMDYFPQGITVDGELRAQAVFLRNEVLTAARTLAEAAGLRLHAVVPRPYALARLAESVARPDEAVAMFAVGEGGGELVVAQAGEVLFARTVPESAFETDKSLTLELRRNLVVAQGMPAVGTVSRLIVAESPDAPRSVSEMLGTALGLPVGPLDPLSGVDPATTARLNPRHAGLFAAIVGVGLLKAEGGALPVNFASPRQPRAEPSKNRPKVLIAALLGFVVFAGVVLVSLTALAEADREVAMLQEEATQLEADANRLQLSQKRLAAIDEFEGRQVVWLDELYDLSARMPDVGKMTVTQVSGTAITPTRVKPGQKPLIEPVAALRVEYRTTDGQLPQRLADTFQQDEFAVGFKTDQTPPSGGKGPVFVLSGKLMRRPPFEYDRVLNVTMPKAPPEEDAEVTMTDRPEAEVRP